MVRTMQTCVRENFTESGLRAATSTFQAKLNLQMRYVLRRRVNFSSRKNHRKTDIEFNIQRQPDNVYVCRFRRRRRRLHH